MKQGSSLVGRNVINFTIPDHSTLRGKSCVLIITIDGRKVFDYVGTFPVAEGLSVLTVHSLLSGRTIRIDTTIAGVAVAAARDGALALSQ